MGTAPGNGRNGRNGNGESGRRADSRVGARRRRRNRRQRRAAGRRAALLALVLLLLGGVAAVAAGAFTGAEAFQNSCNLSALQVTSLGENSFVYDANGGFLGVIPAENNRQPVSYDEMSPWLPKATVAIEDRRFYQHGGVDFESIVRAAVENFKAQDVVQGGSTITQQLVRNLYQPSVGSERTLNRKIKEACLAIKLDKVWPKQRILGTYMNLVYYGNRAYGVEAAAETYFSKHARELSLPEAALLAGLPQAPSIYDPFRRPQEAFERRNDVLRAMRDVGYITPEQYASAVKTKIDLRPGRVYTKIREPFFFSFVRDQLISSLGANVVRAGGLRIYTTINPRFQRLARTAIHGQLDETGDPSAAIVSINPSNGAIRAMVSVSPGEEGSQFNLAAQGRRQAGSSFKTFVLTEAIRRGINPDTTTYLSAPFTWQPDPQSVPWDVHTYSNTYNGPSTITDATLRSDNTVYARLTLDLGPESVAKLANEMGVRSPLKPVASIGLGTNDVTVLDMASAYATLAAGGVYHEPIAIRKVAFPNGEVVSGADALQLPAPRRVLTDGVAYQVTRVLEKNVLAGTGTAAYFGRPAAGKTGTTDDYTDAWFCGYTPTLATAVWVGYPNAKVSMTNVHGITVAGGTFPARIWHDFVSQALASVPPLDFPLPKEEPVWRPWKGQFAFAGDTSTTETDTAQTDTAETKPGTGHQAPPPPTVVTIPPTTSPPTSPPPTTAPGTTTEGPAPPPPPPQN